MRGSHKQMEGYRRSGLFVSRLHGLPENSTR
jgi:hypothetical protein